MKPREYTGFKLEEFSLDYLNKHIKYLKRTMGVYSLRSADVDVYVGKADCLFTRLRTHVRKRNDIEEVVCLDFSEFMSGLDFYDTKAMLVYWEARIMSALDPIENIKRPCYFHALDKLSPQALNRVISWEQAKEEFDVEHPPHTQEEMLRKAATALWPSHLIQSASTDPSDTEV